MMKFFVRSLLLFSFIASACTLLQAQPEDVRFIKKISDNILSSSSCRDNLLFLTKTIGGRPSGSYKMLKAEKWGIEALKKAGADTVWEQSCKVTHWERGGADSAFISYIDKNGKRIRKSISVLSLGGSSGTGRQGIRYNLTRMGSFAELDSNKENVSGKIVFFNPRFKTDANPISEYSKLSGYRTRGSSAASAYGAKGVIVRSLTNSIDNFPHVGLQTNDKDSPLIPSMAVSTTDANFLDRLFDEGKRIDAEIFTYGKILPDTIGHNIIGELKGIEFPYRYITIGAHLDSWDISEGASDDGTGVVITIELLRALKESGYKPRNTIRFVLFADEENGIHGGNEYAKVAAEKKENHLFAIESDAGGFAPFSMGTVGLSQAAKDKLEGYSYLFKPYLGGSWINIGGADITPLNQILKVPLAALWSDQQRYFKVHHSPSDNFENTDISQIKKGIINVAIMLYLIEKYNLK